jgi:HipA-like C-terminal domain/Calcineurin-like phosphoesterase superfamily domain
VRLWILSDLHIESCTWDLPEPRPDYDVLIAAGDILTPASRGVEWLAERANGKPVIYVPGNHEWYAPRRAFSVQDEAPRAREMAARQGVHFLMRGSVTIGDVRFLGTTLWTDYAIQGDVGKGMAMAQRYLNDHRMIYPEPKGPRFTPYQARDWHVGDRAGEARIPFLSAMSMLQARDGERRSYPEIVDELSRHGANARSDAAELYRRMVFSILISNVDDHLRNHGFLWSGNAGWALAPAYDLNPVPVDVKARILSTNISLDEGTCSIDLALEQAGLFGLLDAEARRIVGEVARTVSSWRGVAAKTGETRLGVERMASAFEHGDLEAALRLVK